MLLLYLFPSSLLWYRYIYCNLYISAFCPEHLPHSTFITIAQVEGSDAAWSRLQLYLLPVSAKLRDPMSPALLLEVLPVAHFYDFQPAFSDCVTAVQDQEYGASPPFGSKANPLEFLAMAEKLQVSCSLESLNHRLFGGILSGALK